MNCPRPQTRTGRPDRRPAAGFTLAEVLVTVGLAAVLLVVYSMVLTSTVFLRRSQWNAQAANLLQEELDSLRLLPFSELTDRTDGNYLNVILNRGGWLIQNDSLDGQGQRLALTEAAPNLGGETGLVALPTDWQDNFTLSVKVRALSTSTAGWDVGLVFRYRDAENYYRYRFNVGGIALDKVVQGTPTTVWSQSTTFNPDEWYTLEVIANNDSLTLKKNGAELTTVTEATYFTGETGLAGFDGALAEFDDVTLTVGAATDSWDFEVYDLDAYPEDWRRIGWPDLPDGQAGLTVADYLSEPTLKEVTAWISWTESDRTKTVSQSTIISSR